jgi:hypothetical protein
VLINKKKIELMYTRQGKSVNDIAKIYGCSISKINYWFKKFKIKKRNISEAIYKKHNGMKDPFIYVAPKTVDDIFLFGLGLGLYWGEGTKSNKNSVRLGNTDPCIIRSFIRFLKKVYNIDSKKLKYGLQVFNDVNPATALSFWMKELNADKTQFQKVIVSSVRGPGSYKIKSRFGVLTIYFHNMKLKKILIQEIENIKKI